MSKIRSGNIVIRTEGDSVTFEIVGQKNAACATIGSRDLPEIMEFLQSYQCSQSNRRMGFRINLEPIRQSISGRFRVIIATDQWQRSVTPIDLSLSGVCVASEDLLVEHGSDVNIVLSFDERQVLLPATVVRKRANDIHTAFHFTGVVKNGVLAPPLELQAIFRRLEAHWLDHSLQLKWFDRDQGDVLRTAAVPGEVLTQAAIGS
jgi:hypothetical protein